MRETFRKDERLCSRNLIRLLYTQGRSFNISPFRIRWLFTSLPSQIQAQVLLSVPKTLFPLATNRNLIKRRMREAYRKNKNILYEISEKTGRRMIFSIIYNSKEILPFHVIQEKIILLLHRLRQENEKAAG